MGFADAARLRAASAISLALIRLGRALALIALAAPSLACAASMPDTSAWHAPLLAPAPVLGTSMPDTSAWHVELGGSVDGTNEIFYQGAFVDTVFLPRQVSSEPETRTAAVGLAALSGTCAGRRGSYSLQATGQYGDKVKAGDWLATWRQSVSRAWRLGLDQHLDYRDDRSFGRLTQEWLGGFAGSVTRRLPSSDGQLELANSISVEDVLSDTTGFLLTNVYDRTTLSVEGADPFRNDWGATASFGARVFQDSVSRDQNEAAGTARWRQYHGARGDTEILLGLTRRWPRRDVPSTRDRFLLGSVSLQNRFRLGTRWTSISQLDVDDTRYDHPDDVYFDYAIARAAWGIRAEPDWRLSITAGPRVEWLRAPSMPPEEYLEGAFGVDGSWIRPAGYLSLVPSVGYRDYSGATAIEAFPVQHSSYAYVEASAYIDHALPARLRIRGAGDARWERHTNPDDDLTSLYFSIDLRRIF